MLQTSAGIITSSITDHYPTILSFHDNNIKIKTNEKWDINKKRFIKLCEEENWNQVLEISDNEQALELLIDKINYIKIRSTKRKPKSPKKNVDHTSTN